MIKVAPISDSSAAIPHLGELLRRARQARGLSQAQVARACAVHRSTILHFEQHGKLFRQRETYAQYVQALAAGSEGCPDLQIDPPRLALLHELFECAQPARVRADEARLGAISLAATRDSDAPALRALLDQLRTQPFPGAILDELGFVHAANGALFNLFGAAPDHPYYQRWEAWHAFASKLVRVSPVRQAYTALQGDDLFFTAALYQYFEHIGAYRYLFTRQMRALNLQMAELAHQEGYPQYEAGWRLVSALQVLPGLDQVLRIVRTQDEFLVLMIVPAQPCLVPLRGNGVVAYILVTWQPCGATSERVLANCRDNRLFFAADCDRHHTFHVNTWPAVQHR
jgi:transcriptional regulator with XRE-family HTH domain